MTEEEFSRLSPNRQNEILMARAKVTHLESLDQPASITNRQYQQIRDRLTRLEAANAARDDATKITPGKITIGAATLNEWQAKPKANHADTISRHEHQHKVAQLTAEIASLQARLKSSRDMIGSMMMREEHEGIVTKLKAMLNEALRVGDEADAENEAKDREIARLKSALDDARKGGEV